MSGEWNCRADGVAGFDKGRWPVRFPANRAGFSPAPVSPIWAIARVSLSNRDTAAEISRLIAARKPPPSAPADRRWPGRSGSASGSEG